MLVRGLVFVVLWFIRDDWFRDLLVTGVVCCCDYVVACCLVFRLIGIDSCLRCGGVYVYYYTLCGCCVFAGLTCGLIVFKC